MEKHFSCSRGHRWQVALDGDLALAVGTISCPECGAAAETLVAGDSATVSKVDSPPLSVKIVCKHCGKSLKVKGALAGKKIKCPGCSQIIAVPLASSAPAENSELKTLPPDAAMNSTVSTGVAQSVQTMAALPETAEQSFDFLGPSQQEDELGRLGPYRVLKVLGAGGMGVVFRAEDPQLQRPVALKAMLPAVAASQSARLRFLREARAAAAIKHDHIVSIYQVGEDRGCPFLAMEFLEGEPLDEKLKREKALPIPEVLRIGREMAEGLAAAHERGLIHRDIKPANAWLETIKASPGRKSGEFRVKILDFGLARASQEETHLTQTGAIVGTPAYMAPEQAQSRDADARSDLFSLGCVLYEMTTGQRPFQGRDTLSILMALATHEPRSPRELNPKIPEALSELTMQLLAKDPKDRPDSARAVIEVLQDIENGLPTSGISRRPRKPKSRWLVATVVAAILLAIAGVAAVTVFRVATPEGEFHVEVTDDAVALAIDKQGGLKLIDRTRGREYSIKARQKQLLPTGNYELAIAEAESGLEFSAHTFTIKGRDGAASVRVSFKKAVAQAKEEPTRPGPAYAEVRRMTMEANIRHAAAVPNSPFILIGCTDGNLRLWDVDAGMEKAAWQAHDKAVNTIRILPADPTRAWSSGDDGTMRISDLVKHQVIGKFDLPGVVKQFDVSSDGKLIVCGSGDKDADLLILDATSGKQLARFERAVYGDKGQYKKVVGKWGFGDPHFCSDRLVLYAGNTSPLTLFDWKDKKHVFKGVWEDQCFDLTVSCDGHWALTGHRGKRGPEGYDYSLPSAVRLWDLHDRSKPPAFLGEHAAQVFAVAISPNSRLGLSGDFDGKMCLWDLKAGRKLHDFAVSPTAGQGSNRTATSVLFAAEDRYAVGAYANVLKVYRLSEGEATSVGVPFKKPNDQKKFDIPPAKESPGEVRRMSHPDNIKSVAFSPDSEHVLTGDWKGILRLWNIKNGKEQRAWQGHNALTFAVRFSPVDPRLAFSYGYNAVSFWKVDDGSLVRKLALEDASVWWSGADFSSDGKLVVIGGPRLWVFDVHSGTQLARHDRKGIRYPAFAGGDRVAFGRPAYTTLWDWKSGNEVHRFPGAGARVLTVSRDARWLLSGDIEGVVRLFSLEDLTRPPSVFKMEHPVTCIAISADGKRGVCGNGHLLTYFDFSGGKTTHFDTCAGLSRRQDVGGVDFSPDARYAVSVGFNNLLQLWRLPE